MKTTFKRVLSTVIALCVLLASATCLMGMSVSADETPTDTTVFVWKDAPNNLSNTSAQYVRFGGCGYTDLLKGIADVLWGQDEGETVRITFDYYNPDGGAYEVRKNPTGAYNWGDNTLTLGSGLGSMDVSWTATQTHGGGCVEPMLLSLADNTGKTLYVWNVHIWAHHYKNGEWHDVEFSGDEITHLYPVTATSEADILSETTYGELDLPEVDDDEDDDDSTDATVFVWENAPLDQYLRFGGCGYTDLLKGIADVLWGQDEGEEVKISFDYYNPDGGAYEVRKNPTGAYNWGDNTLTLGSGVGSMDVSWTATGTNANGCAEPQLHSLADNTGKTLYVWNIHIWARHYKNAEWHEVEFSGDEITHLYPTTATSEADILSETTYGELDLPEVDDDEDDEDDDDDSTDVTVFVWEDAPLEQYLRFGGCGYSIWNQGIADVLWGQDEGEEVRVSFDYYNPSNGDYEIRKNPTGSYDWGGQTLSLYPGEGSIEVSWTATETNPNACVEPMLHSLADNSGKTLYVWNVHIWARHYKNDEWHEVEFSGDDITHIYPTSATSEADVLPETTYDQLEIVEYDDGLPDEIEANKMMIKMENYKYREDIDESLKYNQFMWTCNEKYCNAPIKAETTYVFEFEYYCDPGPFELGCVGPSCLARTLNTGVGPGSQFPNGGMDLYWDEYNQAYNIMILKPAIGRAKAVMEFDTIVNQTDFFVGLQQGHDGDLYARDFKLYEKDGDGTNLLKYPNFYGEWEEYSSIMAPSVFTKQIMVGKNSFDGKGAFSFVPFNTEIADLDYGDYIYEELPDDYFDNIFGDEDEDEDEDLWGDDEDDYSDEEIADTGDTSNTATAVAIMFFALTALAATSLKIFRKE